MPEEFDPKWEYWMPSVEWLEAFETTGRPDNPFDLLLPDNDTEIRINSSGFRYGKTKDFFRYMGRMAGRSYKLQKKEPSCIYHRKCTTCKEFFLPHYKQQIHCSNKCYKRKGKKKTLKSKLNCVVCATPFVQLWAKHTYCSRKCAGLMGNKIQETLLGIKTTEGLVPDGCCKECHNPIPTDRGGHGSPIKFCSIKCKRRSTNRTYYQRKNNGTVRTTPSVPVRLSSS